MVRILIPRTTRFILIMLTLLLSIPVHEYGHLTMAEQDGARVLKVNFFSLYNGTHFTNPSITVDEFSFSSIDALVLYYFGGMLITLIPGLIISIILYLKKSNLWKYPYVWVISAPLMSLSDIDRIFELLGLSDMARWMHVGLGAYTVLALGLMRRRGK